MYDIICSYNTFSLSFVLLYDRQPYNTCDIIQTSIKNLGGTSYEEIELNISIQPK